MPFDGLLPKTIDQLAGELAQRRRNNAATIWRNVPAEKFDISTWCGTSACAIGWLVKMQVDGWGAIASRPDYPHRRGSFTYKAALLYFGLTWSSVEMFEVNPARYRVADASQITGAMVADMLLRQPIVLNDELLAEAAAMAAA